MRVEAHEVEAGNHFQQGSGVNAPTEFIHVAGNMVGHPFVEIFAEHEFRFALVNEPEEFARGQRDVIAHVFIVEFEHVGVFVADCETAGGGCEHHIAAVAHGFANGAQVYFGIARGILDTAVGDLCHSTAFLLFEKAHAYSHRIEHFYEIHAQLRIVVVYITSVEIGHMAAEFLLLGLGMFAEPGFELNR